MERFAVLIPAYDAAETIGPVVQACKQYVETVLVVDDGSSDETQWVAKALAGVVLRFEKNRGKGAALIAGLSWLKANGYEAAITLDADGQHPAASIPDLIAKYDETGCDLVLGARPFALHKMPFSRFLANRLSSFWVSVACRTRIPDSQCGFRLYKLSSLELVALRTRGFETETEVLLQTYGRGGTIEAVEVPLIYPEHGASHFRQLIDTLKVAAVIVRYLFGLKRRES